MALLVDLSSGQTLYAREAQRRFMPASITKVMTTYLAFELISRGKLSRNQRITVSDDAFTAWHRKGSTMFLARGSQVSVDELLHGITTVSANDGCIVLAEGAAGSIANWVRWMNAEARALGMKDSHFGTPNGWMDDGRTYVSARDLAILAHAMISRHPELYHHYVGRREFTYQDITQPNHDPITGVVRGADGIKTGFTNQAGYGFLGSAVRDGRRLVLVIAGADSGRARNRAARALIEWGYTAWDSQRLFGASEQVGEARVQGGGARTVGLLAARPINLVTPLGQTARFDLVIHYDGPLQAPVAAGTRVADLEIRIDGRPGYFMPLLAQKDVALAGPVERLANGLLGIFS